MIFISKRINLTVSDEKYEFWKQEAERRKLKLPEFIRRAVDIYITVVKSQQKLRNQKS